jgi:hypothetical protein
MSGDRGTPSRHDTLPGTLGSQGASACTIRSRVPILSDIRPYREGWAWRFAQGPEVEVVAADAPNVEAFESICSSAPTIALLDFATLGAP